MKLKIMVLAAVLGLPALLLAADAVELVKIVTSEQNGRLVDDINLPFVNDPDVIGEWYSVDFVRDIKDFVPGAKRFKGELYLGGFLFKAEGAMGVMPNAPDSAPWFKWTKGVVTHSGDRTASRYTIKEMNGAKYMFLEWKSGDYTIKHKTPQYYVLKKK